MSDSLKEFENKALQSGQPKQSMKTLTLGIYVLQGLSIFFGITALVGVVLNYLKKNDVQGTWLESHFRWQIATFWVSLILGVVGTLTTFFGVGYLILLAVYVWIIYRVYKGWKQFKGEREI